jgi:hypothetical protein
MTHAAVWPVVQARERVGIAIRSRPARRTWRMDAAIDHSKSTVVDFNTR